MLNNLLWARRSVCCVLVPARRHSGRRCSLPRRPAGREVSALPLAPCLRVPQEPSLHQGTIRRAVWSHTTGIFGCSVRMTLSGPVDIMGSPAAATLAVYHRCADASAFRIAKAAAVLIHMSYSIKGSCFLVSGRGRAGLACVATVPVCLGSGVTLYGRGGPWRTAGEAIGVAQGMDRIRAVRQEAFTQR